MECKKCKHINKKDTVFCEKCGTLLDETKVVCSHCKSLNNKEESYCLSCGNSLLEDKKVCFKCGNEIDINAYHCSYCGTKVGRKKINFLSVSYLLLAILSITVFGFVLSKHDDPILFEFSHWMTEDTYVTTMLLSETTNWIYISLSCYVGIITSILLVILEIKNPFKKWKIWVNIFISLLLMTSSITVMSLISIIRQYTVISNIHMYDYVYYINRYPWLNITPFIAVIALIILIVRISIIISNNTKAKKARMLIKSNTSQTSDNPVKVLRKEKYDLVMTVLLMVITLGIYLFILVYKYAKDINNRLNIEDTSTIDLILFMFLPLYYIYWAYKYSKRFDQLCMKDDITIKNLSILPVLFMMIHPFLSLTVLCDQFNDYYDQVSN